MSASSDGVFPFANAPISITASFDYIMDQSFKPISILHYIDADVVLIFQDKLEEQTDIVGNLTLIKEMAATITDRANYTFYSFSQVQFFFEELHIACVEQSRSDTSFQLTLTVEKLEALATHLLKVVKFFQAVTKLYEKWNKKILNFVR